MYLYDIKTEPPALGAFGALAETGRLKRFSPSDLVLTPDETRDVLRFFWPETDFNQLGPLTDGDREFAQGLLVEAVDASCSMGVVEGIYRSFFMKVPTSFRSIVRAAIRVARKAVQDRLFGRCRSLDPSQARIYESVRRSLARNFRTVWALRRQTGELTY